MKLKVATYNIMSGRNYSEEGKRSFDYASEVINAIDADIVGLNEVGTHAILNYAPLELDCGPCEYIGKKTGMYNYFAKAIEVGGHPYGNGILSKHPIKSAKTVIIPDVEVREEKYKGYYETRNIIVAEIDVCGGITVLVSHFGLVPEEAKNAVDTALSIIKSTEGPVLLMGDFNMLADDEKLKPIFEVLCDTAKGEKEPFTWPSDEQKKVSSYEEKIKEIKGNDTQRKIDYIFTSPHFETKGILAYQSMVSDHRPFVANLEIGE